MRRQHPEAPGLVLPRHPGDVVRVAVAIVIIIGTAVFVHRHRVAVLEVDVFRVANDLPGWMFPFLWPVMQAGNLLAVPLIAISPAATRRFRLAVEIAVTGTGMWLLAKLVKDIIVRGRPETLLTGVHIRGGADAGSGYLSGHAAVAAAMATLIIPYLNRPWRRVAVGGLVTVGVARMYVGAHLPLDVIGGAALGWGVASAVHLVLGAPSGRPPTAQVVGALRKLGYASESVAPLGLDARRSALFEAIMADGVRLFVKVIPLERRDHDLLYRMWQRVAHPRHRGMTPVAGREALEHEALMTMEAARAGVYVAPVIAVGDYRHGGGILVQEWIDGSPLVPGNDAQRATGGSSQLVGKVWAEVAKLHCVRVAHRALFGDHLLIDGEGDVYVIGFADAVTSASNADLSADIADVVAVTAALVGEPEAGAAAQAYADGAGITATIEELS